VASILTDAGEELVYPVAPDGSGLAGWHSWDGPPEGVGAVCLDWSSGKFRHVLAGFYRGRKVPVVYIAGTETVTPLLRCRVVAVRSVEQFRSWLASGPAYLKPQGSGHR
jgi:hypothetical protein